MQDFSVDDRYLHCKLTELHVLPGQDSVVGTVRSVRREKNGYLSRLWTFPLDGRPPRQLTSGPDLDSSPRVAPGGDRVAFTADRAGGSDQPYLIAMGGGEAQPCGLLEGSVSSPRWLPDGKASMVTAVVKVDPNRRGERGGPPEPREPGSPELAWRLPYKTDGIGYTLAGELRQSRLYAYDFQENRLQALGDESLDVAVLDDAEHGSEDGRDVVFVRANRGCHEVAGIATGGSAPRVVLVLYPGEDHLFLGEGKPKCRADAARRIVDWATQRVAPATGAPA